MPYSLPELPYKYDALEPHIDAQTMEVHYSKHHQGYLNKLNTALENNPEISEKPIEEVLMHLHEVPEEIRLAVKNNGGGYFHHSLFWEMIGPNGGGEPSGEIGKAIDEAFGSFEDFKEAFSNAAVTAFGSAWTWLCVDKNDELTIISTPNQDSPVSMGLLPILGIDVWEHAYYLKYQNRRPDYIEAFWNVINWEKVEEFYKK